MADTGANFLVELRSSPPDICDLRQRTKSLRSHTANANYCFSSCEPVEKAEAPGEIAWIEQQTFLSADKSLDAEAWFDEELGQNWCR